MKRSTVEIRIVMAVALMLAPIIAADAQTTRTRTQKGTADGAWEHYSGDKWSPKYSPLDQINQSNVDDLVEAWRWEAKDTYPPVRRVTLSVDTLEKAPAGAKARKAHPDVVGGVEGWLACLRQAPGSNGADLDAVREKIITQVLALAGG